MTRFLLLLAVAGGLAACAGSMAPRVSYPFVGDDVSDADRQADRYCRQYGKPAYLKSVRPIEGGGIADYECG